VRRTLHYPAPLQGKSDVAHTDFTELHAAELSNYLPEVNRFIRRRPPAKLVCPSLVLGLNDQYRSVPVQDPEGQEWAIVFHRNGTGAVSAVAHRTGVLPCETAEVCLTPASQAYFNAAGSLSEDLEAATISGVNFILNRNVETSEQEIPPVTAATDVPYYVEFTSNQINEDQIHRLRLSVGTNGQPGFVTLDIIATVSDQVNLANSNQPPSSVIIPPAITAPLASNNPSANIFHSVQPFSVSPEDQLALVFASLMDVPNPAQLISDLGYAPEAQDNFILLRPRMGVTPEPLVVGQEGVSGNPIVTPTFVTPPAGLNILTNPTLDFIGSYISNFGGVGVTPFIKSINPNIVSRATTVATFNDLPSEGPENVVFTVTDTGSTFVYDPTFGTTGGYRETAVTPDGLDRNTMPMGATYDGVKWTIDTLDWENKTSAADPTLIPSPSFLGESIRDLGLFRGRLALLHRRGVTLSASTSNLNFYPTSTDTATAGDPIDLQNTLARDTVFHWLVPYNRRLLILAQDAILEVVATSGVLSVETVELRNVTVQPCSSRVRPISSSGILFFGTDTGESTIDVSEFTVTTTGRSQAIAEDQIADTSNILLPLQLEGPGFISMSQPSLFFAQYLSQGASKIIHHTFRKVQGQRVQNAFVDVEFPQDWTIFGLIAVSSSRVGVHYTDSQGVLHYAEMDYSINNKEVLLDAVTTGTPTLTQTSPPQTSYNLPHSAGSAVPLIVATGDLGPFPTGYAGVVTAYTDTSVTIAGDWTAQEAVVGFNYISKWTLPEPFVFTRRDRSDNVPSLSTKSIVSAGVVAFTDTGALEVVCNGESIDIFSVDTGVEDGQLDFSVASETKDLSLSFQSFNHEPANISFASLYVRSFGRA